MLLGRIVETVSGMPYDDYAAHHIWGRAGMEATGNQPESILLRRAIAYTGTPGKLVRADDTCPIAARLQAGAIRRSVTSHASPLHWYQES